MRKMLAMVAGLAALSVALTGAQAPRVTSPTQQLGHNFGDDYYLANYTQIADYWKKLDAESDRMVVQSIGRTAEGRDQLMAIVTSPENHRNLARYKDISRRLALAEDLSDADARALAKEGKAIVWIDGGLHASESLGAQQLAEMVYQMVSRTDEETMRILNDVIILFVHANPDGNELIADWYMREPVATQRRMGGFPRLYQKYIGHDNNRDFFASTQAETENINRVLYREWYPQILYNHHQSGPAGTVLWSPPLRDPFNYNQDPLLVLGIQTIGIALHTRLAAEGKPGATMRSGGSYDGWWNGGIRNTAAFHNTIAILTEMIGDPTPTRVPFVLNRQIPNSDLTYPVPPQDWHFRQSIDYSIACNLGVLDIASRMKENFQYNRYLMGKNSIERGRTDTWTVRPHRVEATTAAVGTGAAWAALHQADDRDPRGYILPANQPDFPTATKFINALLETGIRVHRATAAFTAQGKQYPAGSFVVMTDQAFRPHVIDMFEPQDHPDNFAYQGAPPTRPYDNAGWTLAFQMGVEFDRILDPFTGPFAVVPDWNVAPPPGQRPGGVAGNRLTVRLSPAQADTFAAVNRLLAAGHPVVRAADGSFVATLPLSAANDIPKLGQDRGVNFLTAPADAATGAKPVTKPRIGLWDTYGGSIDSGWARWILEQFEFPFARVFAQELDAGNLRAKYDTLIFVDGGIPAGGGGRGAGAGAPAGAAAGAGARAGARAGAGAGAAAGAGAPAGGGGRAGGGAGPAIPAEYQAQTGSVSVERTLPQLKAFLEAGGTVIAIGGSATNLARFLNLPIENHLVENGTALPQTKFYAPGSILSARVDTTSPVASGMKEHTDFFFDNSPVWKLGANAAAMGVTPVAWFDSKTPLRSGWAWGQAYLENGVIAVDAKVGQGRALLFGAEILQRAQPHATFKLLFNGIYLQK